MALILTYRHMTQQEIIKLLEGHEQAHVEKFASYCVRLLNEVDKQKNTLKNPWMKHKSPRELADLFKRVAVDGLVFDGVHITLQSTGISYDYIAYKNKMLLSYPESLIDMALVYKDDQFSFKKESGRVEYSHSFGNPLQQKEADVIGGYCVIRNKRGEFITLLSKEDIEKHRKAAKTDFIWKQWFKEMALKTVIKKACKQHFDDIYQNIEENDNENYAPENPQSLPIDHKSNIDAITSMEKLKEYWSKNRGLGKEFDRYVTVRREQIKSETQSIQ